MMISQVGQVQRGTKKEKQKKKTKKNMNNTKLLLLCYCSIKIRKPFRIFDKGYRSFKDFPITSNIKLWISKKKQFTQSFIVYISC